VKAVISLLLPKQRLKVVVALATSTWRLRKKIDDINKHCMLLNPRNKKRRRKKATTSEFARKQPCKLTKADPTKEETTIHYW